MVKAMNTGILDSMMRLLLRGILLVCLTLGMVGTGIVLAQDAGNPYASIVARNPFGLKDPPPPVPPPPPPPPPALPSPDIKLTGITSLFNQNKALLEITKKGPDAGNKPLKLIINEGETKDGVKVVSIDMIKNLVEVQIGDLVTNVTFSVASSTSKAAPGKAGLPGRTPSMRTPVPSRGYVPTAAAATDPGGPVVVNSRMNNTSRGVNVMGGTSPTIPTAAPSVRSTVPSYNATATAASRRTATANSSANSSANRLRSIPTRTIRTDTAPTPNFNREEAYILIEAQRALQETGGGNPAEIPFPLPHTPYTPQQ